MRRKLANQLISLLVLALLVCLAFSVKADFQPERLGPNWLTQGFQPMCEKIPAECAPYDDDRQVIRMTEERFQKLGEVNRQVNREITYQTDLKHYGKPEVFTYPTDGIGDCEDYALEKRRRLVAEGWPRRALLLAIVDTPSKKTPELHAILIARTDRGDLVLDIETHDLRATTETPYEFDWLQSGYDPREFEFQPKMRSPK